MTYRPDIDGLRAIAVLLVLIFHFDLLGVGKAGFIGVDVFFVISGFLIASILVKDLENGQFHFGRFLYRRIRRLYPALLVTLGLTMVAGYWLFLPDRFEELARETVYSLLYVVNFHFWQNVSYFGLQAGEVPLLHMWSLAVEEQFYAVFPLALFLAHRWFPRHLLAIVAGVAVLGFAGGFYVTGWKPVAAFYLLPTRAWELLAGAVLALAVRHRPPESAWLHLMGPLGLGLIALAVALYSPLTAVPGWFALLPVLGAAAIILGGFRPGAPVTRALASAPMVWIGLISYPLYLVHWPVRIFLQEHAEAFTFEWRLAGFALSFALAALIYAWIERPVRRRRVLVGPARFLWAASAGTACLLVLGVLTLRTEGAPGRFPPEVSRLLAYVEDQPEAYNGCRYRPGGDLERACHIGAEEAPKSVLVIGDSHARAFAGAFDGWLAAQGRGGALVFQYGCMPVLRSGGPECGDFAADVVGRALADPGIEEVVLSSIWRQALPEGGKPLDGRWVPPDQVEGVFADLMSETVDRLVRAGKRVTVIDPFFAAKRPVPRTWADNIAFGRTRAVAMPLADHQAEFSNLHALFTRLGGLDVRRVSLIAEFCKTGTCIPEVAGRPLFTDANHLAFSHSGLLAEILLREAPAWPRTSGAVGQE